MPRKLTYVTMCQLLSEYYRATLQDVNSMCQFDWRDTVWADLPELVSILNWSSKLVSLTKEVAWELPHPLRPPPEQDGIQDRARASLGRIRYNWLSESLQDVRQKLSKGQLYPHARRNRLSEIREELRKKGEDGKSGVEEWLALEATKGEYADFLAYLQRYDTFRRAKEAGITINPDPRSLPKSALSRSPETACLELRNIRSSMEIDTLVDGLDDANELARILGSYADMDIASRGAFANIIVTELGLNVVEHSDAGAGWICTRLVTDRNVSSQCEGDPAVKSFAEDQSGFLEVIICDNGKGLTHDMERILRNDERETVREKYLLDSERLVEEYQLIDYAFDRLVSSKRDISHLVNFAQKSIIARGTVASGLYWIWNVVRAHSGIISIRTGNVCGWYDFTNTIHTIVSWHEGTTKLHIHTADIPFCGTMIRVCLPLGAMSAGVNERIRMDFPRKTQTFPVYSSRESNNRIHVEWCGDFAKSVSLSQTGSEFDETSVIGLTRSHQLHLLEELQRLHTPISDGDSLVLDLCGIPHKWAMESANPLCHFFMEMNYTSPIGRSAVVLWNVPSSKAELFETALRDAYYVHPHLQDFRRIAFMIWDTGRVKLLCGWPEAEQMLETLAFQGDLDLSEMGTSSLSDDDSLRFRALISENSHLFAWAGENRVQLRIWPSQIAAEVWVQCQLWFEGILEQTVDNEGVCVLPLSGYFRLPSSGHLVNKFYQFEMVLSDSRARSRIVWMLTELLLALERKCGSIEWIVAVTRPVMSLAVDVIRRLESIGSPNIPKPLAMSSIEELEECADESMRGTAVLLTDVISTGTLCQRADRALHNIEWSGVVALLDTRDRKGDAYRRSEPLNLYPDISIQAGWMTDLGPVFALASRSVEKHLPREVGEGESIWPIDGVNVCPKQFPDLLKTRLFDIWGFLANSPDTLKIGHYHGGSNHHYIYYINALSLFSARESSHGHSFSELIANDIVEYFDNEECDPERTVIMHPPRASSYAEELAKEVQERTGALYRVVLYRDTFADQWRFSPFVDRGLSIGEHTAILIDDGSNTGETLIGMLDAAAYAHASQILAYVGVTRMPLHKVDMLRRINGLRDVTGDVTVRFAAGMGIPVHSSRSCPVCRLGHGFSEVSNYSRIFAHDAGQMKAEIGARPTGRSIDGVESFSLWICAEPLNAARIREEIELVDYPMQTYPNLQKILRIANSGQLDMTDPLSAMLDFAFVISAEPDLAAAPVLAPFVDDLLCVTYDAIKSCPGEQLMTYVGLSFQLLYELRKRTASTVWLQRVAGFWQALLQREEISIGILLRILAYLLARTMPEPSSESGPYITVCEAIAEEMVNQFTAPNITTNVPETSLIWPSGRLMASEMLSVLQSAKGSRAFRGGRMYEYTGLHELAVEAAGKFSRHRKLHIGKQIDDLRDSYRQMGTETQKAAANELLCAFYDLHKLQEHLWVSELRHQKMVGQSPGARVYWAHPEFEAALSDFGASLLRLAESIESDTGAWSQIALLSQAWETLHPWLDPIFDEIFPDVFEVVTGRWGEWAEITQLPMKIAAPISRTKPGIDLVEIRAFISRTLLFRFVTIAMENLRTAAFRGWNLEQLEFDAKARVEIITSNGGTSPSSVCIRICDNGMLNRKLGSSEEPHLNTSSGSGLGLKEIREMAEFFGATLNGPYLLDQETCVDLWMKTQYKGDIDNAD